MEAIEGKLTTSPASTRLFNTAAAPHSWEFDHAGFLKCRTTVLRSCVLTYSATQLNMDGIPHELRGKDSYKLFVPEEELASSRSLDSLDGRPVNVDHTWETILETTKIGNIAGKTYFDDATKMVHANILVTDPAVINRIVSDKRDKLKLVEQSAGYACDIDWTPGVTPDGEYYDGVQRNIVYNHVALVGEGKGRAGSSVRILNKRSCDMAEQNDFTRVKVWGKSIRVLNADVEDLEKTVSEKDEQVSSLVDSAALDDAISKIADFESKIAALEEEKAVFVGQIEELKAKLEEATSQQTLENEMSQAMEDQEDAQKVYNSLGFDNSDEKFTASVSASKKLFGNALYKHVVNSVRLLNSKDALSDDESEGSIKGRFKALVEFSEMGLGKKTINGAEAMRMLNSNDGISNASNASKLMTAEQRRQNFYKMQKG